jgi:2-polyprenyl-6-methoxyphenol hydroxylase-like FAD-dependent oxidoreductase
VVIGSGIAGLLAARIASDHFSKVTIIDRDTLPTSPEIRKKTPQAPHSHVMGSRGYKSLLALFPGIDKDLAEQQAPAFDFTGDCPLYLGEWAPRQPSGLESRLCTRMLLEYTMRNHVRRLDNVTFVEGRVEGPTWDEGKTRITGVKLEGGTSLACDLLFDTAGMSSKTFRWVDEAGCGKVRESGIDLHGATITRVFKPLPDHKDDWVAIFVRPTDDNHRAGAITRIENNLWRVSLSGMAGIYPPRAEDGFLEFARAMPTQAIYDLIVKAEPVSPVYYFGNSFSRWMHYEELSRMPDGVVVLGDAVFHANAEHAQGMTFCLLGAVMLGNALADAGRVADASGFSLGFQRQLADLCRPYWHWNNALELVLPNVEVNEIIEPADRLVHELYRRVRAMASKNPELLKAALAVTQAETHPGSMLRPSVLLRAARLAIAERGAAAR